MADQRITIATQFTHYPGARAARYRKDGAFSGEEFRDDILVPALRKASRSNSVVIVVLDGVAGYGAFFLEEAFGGLVRIGFSREFLHQHLRIEAQTPQFRNRKIRADSYIVEEAARRLQTAI